MAHRDVMQSRLGEQVDAGDDVNPMESVANLADCMLVLVCGLFLALVIRFNLDISQNYEEVVEDDVTEVSADIADMATSMAQGAAGYEELGMVYQDPQTGKMYMVRTKQD